MNEQDAFVPVPPFKVVIHQRADGKDDTLVHEMCHHANHDGTSHVLRSRHIRELRLPLKADTHPLILADYLEEHDLAPDQVNLLRKDN